MRVVSRFAPVVVTALLCSAGNQPCGQELEYLSEGMPNQAYWEALGPKEKAELLYGVDLGVNLFYDESKSSLRDRREVKERLTIEGFPVASLVQQVDTLYRDRSNVRIPIPYAYVYNVERTKGASQAELDKLASKLRGRFSERK